MKFKHGIRNSVILIAAAMVFVCAYGIRAADSMGTVQGVVKNSSGDPVTGAFVKLKNADRRLVFMVISQAKGHFEANNLPPGQYVAEGIAEQSQSDWSAPVDVAAGQSATVNLSLTEKRADELAPAWPGRPHMEAGVTPKLPDGEGKQIVENRCTTCHDTVRIVGNRTDRQHWQMTIRQMRENMQALPADKQMTDDEAKVLLDYVSANFTPLPKPDPNSRLPVTLQTGRASKYTAVEFTMPDVNAEPHDVTVALNGDGWANERTGGNLAHLNPVTFDFEEITPPAGEAKRSRLGGITRGPDGDLWVVDGSANNRVLRYDPKTKEFTAYEAPKLPHNASISANTMRIDAKDQTAWATAIAASKILELDIATKEVTYLDIPEAVKRGTTATPYGMAIAGDGKVWFAENAFDMMARIDPATGKIDEYKIPIKGAVPRRMGADAEGNIWVGLHGACKLMKIDYKTTKMSFYTPPTPDCGTYSVSPDLKHNVIWVSEQQADKIARFDPKTGQWLEFPLPDAESDSRRIEIDPNDTNRIWWSGDIPGRIGYIQLIDTGTSGSRSGK